MHLSLLTFQGCFPLETYDTFALEFIQILGSNIQMGNTMYKVSDYGMYVGCAINLEHIFILKRADNVTASVLQSEKITF